MFSYAQAITPNVRLIDTFERMSSRTFRIPSVKRVCESMERSRDSSEVLTRLRIFGERLDDISNLANLSADWNSYGSPVPSSTSIKSATKVLSDLNNIFMVPDKVLPSAEGGVAMTFLSESRNRAVIETLNNGEAFILLYDLDGNNETLDLGNSDLEHSEKFGQLKKHLRGLSLASS